MVRYGKDMYKAAQMGSTRTLYDEARARGSLGVGDDVENDSLDPYTKL